MRPRFNEQGRKNYYVKGYAGEVYPVRPNLGRRSEIDRTPSATLGQPEVIRDEDAEFISTVPEL